MKSKVAFFVFLLFLIIDQIERVDCRRHSRLLSLFSRDYSGKTVDSSDTDQKSPIIVNHLEPSGSSTANDLDIGRSSMTNHGSAPMSIPFPMGLMPFLVEPAIPFSLHMTHAFHPVPNPHLMAPFVHLP
jgi:hypothetical protein